MSRLHPGDARRGRGALVVLLLSLLSAVGVPSAVAAPASPPLAAAPAALAAPAAPAAPGGLDTDLVAMSPTSLASGDTLKLTARIRNGTGATLDGATAMLTVNTRASTSRSALDVWAAAGVDGRRGTQVSSQDVPPVAAGATADVTFTLPVAELGLTSRSDWGPHGIAVVLYDADQVAVDIVRTFVVWSPTEPVAPVRLSIAAAVTGPAVDAQDKAADDATLTADVTDGGRLQRLLEVTADRPEVAWVVDPALLAASAASKDAGTREWAASVQRGATDRDVFALTAYDPDLAAFAHAQVPVPAPPPLPGDADPASDWRTDLAWPADPVPDTATAALAAARGATATIVGGGGLAPTEDLTYTPSGVATVDTEAGPVRALLADPVLSDLMAGSGEFADATRAEATQRLLAETAVVARERPNDPRALMVALPRSWEPDVDAFTAQADALAAAGWVDLAPVGSLLTEPVPDVARVPLPASTPSADEIGRADLVALQGARDRVAGFSVIATDPAAITQPLEAGFFVPTAIAYREDAAARSTAVRRAGVAAAAVVDDSVSVPQRTPTNLFGQDVEVPVRVRNDLDQEITVQIFLHPDDSRLRVKETTQVTVPPRSEVREKVPVNATGTGDVLVTVQLRSLAGGDIGPPTTLEVRVEAKWETVATIVFFVLLGAALVAGTWRTIRRGRSPRRIAAAEVDQSAGPDAAAVAVAGRSVGADTGAVAGPGADPDADADPDPDTSAETDPGTDTDGAGTHGTPVADPGGVSATRGDGSVG